jgi:hypothetical protein
MCRWLNTGRIKKKENHEARANYTIKVMQMELQVLQGPKTNYKEK